MKRFLHKHREILSIVSALFIWRIYIAVVNMCRDIVAVRGGYLGFLRAANFDGVYYLSIAKYGYKGLDQAFFPFFPLTINALFRLGVVPVNAAVLVVAWSLLGFLYVLAKLVKIDYTGNAYLWVIVFYLAFPTSFFFGSIYTESLFLFLTVTSFYFARKGKFFIASLFGSFASATRITGIFLLPALFIEILEQQKKEKKVDYKKYLSLCIVPLGLFSYMVFLWYKYQDPLLFLHQQPLFGAGRSGGKIIFLPQVLFRYYKILKNVPLGDLTSTVAILELSTLILGLLLLYLAYKKKIRFSYILYSFCCLIFPTLSGTLSSLPRYALPCFAIFIYLGVIKNPYIKISLIIAGLVLESYFAILFFQGYFVS